jgi:phage tail sheath protein FI
MATLVSPGVSVTVTDESFFIPAAASTVPLIFVATADEKVQTDGTTPAAGTYEHDVVRTVTSLKQSLELYGIPTFLEDVSGNAQHGDARNEYGLFGLNQFLGLGNRAYVVRSNVNLNDDTDTVRTRWDSKITTAGTTLSILAQSFLDEYNNTNGFVSADSGFRTTITDAEIKSLANDATADIWDLAAFAGLETDYFDDNGIPAASTYGSQIIDVGASITDVGGPTGLANDTTVYTATITVDGTAIPVTVTGSAAQTWTSLFGQIDADLGGAATTALTPDDGSPVADNIKITSALLGSASSVSITDGSGATALFANLNGFVSFSLPVNGVTLDAALPVYVNGYSQASTGSYLGFDGDVAAWVAGGAGGSPTPTEWTPTEATATLTTAADNFKYTAEFRNLTSLGANDAARRTAIVTALQATMNGNTEVRSENFEFNLILCPGYNELADEMLALSADINGEAFVIADTPMDMTASEAVAWAGTSARQSSTNIAYYYPHGLASNIDGKNVFVAASGTALRTYAYSDDVSQLWLAPAGTRRGLVTGLTDVGYVSGELGTATTFNPLHVNQGQRDDLYKYFTNVNPIAFFPGRGILIWGQKTSASDASALDRVNVSRLVMYIKRQLRKNTLAFVFEPNDQLTRDNLKAVVDGFLGDIVVKRGLYDFATVCDESNNTPDRIDRNEMYIDVAIKPVKAAEFIYVPIRVVATGAEI